MNDNEVRRYLSRIMAELRATNIYLKNINAHLQEINPKYKKEK